MPFYTLKKAWGTHAVGADVEVKDDATASLLAEAGYVDKAADASVNDAIAKKVLAALAPDLADKMLPQLKAAFADLAAVPDANRPQGVSGVVTDAEQKTKSFGEWLSCVVKGDVDKLTRVYATTKAPLYEGTGSGGSYLVPPDYSRTLLQLSTETGIVRPRAQIIPMGTRTIQVPALKQNGSAQAGQFQFLGGMVATWTEEAATRVETEPNFRQIELIAHELAGYSVASRTLLADAAIALDTLLTTLFAKTIATYEDYAFIAGDGVGKPLGILNSAMTIVGGPNSGSRTASNRFQLADAAWMWANLLPSSQNNAVWIMSQSVLPQLLQLQDGAGNVIFIPNFYRPEGGQGGVQAGVVPMLFGRPIIFTEKVQALGSTGDVMLVDFNYYLIGDRQQIEVAASEHVNFLSNQMTWRFIHRVDGQPWLDAPYHYQDQSTIVSPAVVLHS